jgi:tetratricopeptide (TPR) repeat protein
LLNPAENGVEQMRFSRLGIFLIILTTVIIGANCSYYNQILSRKNLVDGGQAYKDRKFAEAQQLFRDSVARNPGSAEAKMAQLFLARTLHSEYVADRGHPEKAEEAIEAYKKVLAENIADQSSFKAIANLLENLNRQDEWLKWVTDRTNNEQVPPAQRAEAMTSLVAKQYSCANNITDVEPVKKEVTKGSERVYQFTKPSDPKQFEELNKCIATGTDLIDKAVQLDPNSDSAWSYKANMLVQQMRVAEMEGKTDQKENFKKQADVAKAKFTELANIKKKKQEEEDRIKAEKEAAANKK